MSDRPFKITSLDDLKDYYWMKSDLIKFCKTHNLPTQGAKSDLMERIVVYLSTGNCISYRSINKQGEKDSLKRITKKTLVKNYNNDPETRRFFVEHIGKQFKFNAYLRQFTDPHNIQPNMTYGDLVDGWNSFEKSRKNSGKTHVIPSQFEYNQFIKDYFTNEKEATLEMAICAWKTLKSEKGPRTYNRFKEHVKKVDE